MKIAVVTHYNPQNRFDRSGVVNSIFFQLKRFADVIWINPDPVKGIRKIEAKVLIKFIYWMHCVGWKVTRLFPLLTGVYAKEIKSKVPKDVDALFFFDSWHFATLNIDKPIYFRNDSVFHQMVGYYYQSIPKWWIPVADRLEYSALNRMTAMFSPSKWVKDGVHDTYSGNEHKVYVIESGANLYSEPDLKVKSIDQHINLIFIGYQARRKRVEIATECVKLLNEKYHRKAVLSVIGRDVPETVLQSPYINYIGTIDKNKDEDYQKYIHELRKAHILLFPTKAECAGIICCEACAYGIPTIASDTGGVSNYCIDGINGILVSKDDGPDVYAKRVIEMSDPNVYRGYSERCIHEYITRFNWNVWGDKVMSIMLKHGINEK